MNVGYSVTGYITVIACAIYDSGLFQKLSSGVGGPQALFCLVGGGCFVDNVSKGWGGGGVEDNLSWGSRHI